MFFRPRQMCSCSMWPCLAARLRPGLKPCNCWQSCLASRSRVTWCPTTPWSTSVGRPCFLLEHLVLVKVWWWCPAFDKRKVSGLWGSFRYVFWESRKCGTSDKSAMCRWKAAKWQLALQILSDLDGLQGNIITFGAAMNGCERAGEWQQVVKLFEDLQMRGLQVFWHSAVIKMMY